MRKGYAGRGGRGLTLLEVLTIFALAAIVGIGAVSLALDTKETVGMDLVKAEIRAVRDAILRFKKDTGFLPRTGPFDLDTNLKGGQVHIPPLQEDWFYAPANFSQLIEEPLNKAGNPVMPWNPDKGRGWHGPYLQTVERWVDVGNGLKPDGSGSPTSGNILYRVHGVADPFLHKPINDHFIWYNWNHDEIRRYGRPYYFFDWADPDQARIVSSGPNGDYESQKAARMEKQAHPDVGDDIVLFLFH